jgi:hypothetical protein
MAKQYRIHIKGKQREAIDADLMARLVVMLGRQLAEDARQAAEAARGAEAADRPATNSDTNGRDANGGRSATG